MLFDEGRQSWIFSDEADEVTVGVFVFYFVEGGYFDLSVAGDAGVEGFLGLGERYVEDSLVVYWAFGEELGLLSASLLDVGFHLSFEVFLEERVDDAY